MSELLGLKYIPESDHSDVTSLIQELEKTRELCQKLDDIIENTPDGIYVTDGDANAIRINRAFAQISGLKREDMLGVNHRDLEKNHVVAQSSALRVVEERKPVTIIHEYIPTGKQALVTSTPVFDESGEIKLIVSSTRDLTKLNDVEQKLQEERTRRKNTEKQLEILREQMLTDTSLVAVDKKTINMLYTAAKIASVDSTVMINGETGVGKEEIAKYIHKKSPRNKEAFIALNCGAIPDNLVESELFGYEKGAFTGANASGKSGLLELADHGTLFLDEVGELPLDTQTKLLRALETRTVTRIGGSSERPIDIRIISATNRNLQEMIDQEKFRADLYYRLNVVPIYIPALRDRKEDILPLVQQFLKDVNDKYHMKKAFSSSAFQMLYEYSWPGNVRELKNVIERSVVMTEGDYIQRSDIRLSGEAESVSLEGAEDMSLKERLRQMEYYYLKEAYDKYGNIREAAASLAMPHSTFIRKLKSYEQHYQTTEETEDDYRKKAEF